MFKLHKEQEYVFDIAKRLGVEARLVYWGRATDSCEEKFDLLSEYHTGWGSDGINRVIKAVYFSNKRGYVAIVRPHTKSVEIKKAISEVLGVSGKQAKKYCLNGTPDGMEMGTCTPFPFESTVGDGLIEKMIVCDCPEIDGKDVDISVGGCGEDAHKVSMHVLYGGIYRILREKFGDRIHRF